MEHIKNIEIKNFKSIRHQKIEGCKRINVFVGPPNVGKSNLLEALGLFSYYNYETFKINISRLYRFDSFTQLFNYGNVESSIQVVINEQNKLELVYKNEDSLKLNILKFINQNWFDDVTGDSVYKWENLFSVSFTKTEEYIRLNDISKTESEWNLMTVLKYYYKFSQFDKKISAIQLESPYGENLFEVIANNDRIRELVFELVKPFGVRLYFDVVTKKLSLVKMLGNDSIFPLPFNQIADTLQRLIFYLTAIKINNRKVLLFEEPESHCYEPYILEITNALKNDTNNNQFFIVTHSQYVIDELLRDKESRKDTNIYLVGLENSETVVKLLDEETSKDVYEQGLNVFFNFSNLWEETEKV